LDGISVFISNECRNSFAPIASDVWLVVEAQTGLAYNPNASPPYNYIGDMIPGEGYIVYLFSWPIDLEYDCSCGCN